MGEPSVLNECDGENRSLRVEIVHRPTTVMTRSVGSQRVTRLDPNRQAVTDRRRTALSSSSIEVLYRFMSKSFVQGITMTGLKG